MVASARKTLQKNLKQEPLHPIPDEELLEFAIRSYEEQVNDDQHQGAQAGSLSETMCRAHLQRSVSKWTHRNPDWKNKIEKKRDGCLTLNTEILYLENKRVGTDLKYFKSGPLKGRRLSIVYTKRKGSSGQKKETNIYSIHESASPGVFSAHVITLNQFWFFAGHDIVQSDGKMYQKCFIDVDTGEMFIMKGGPQRGKIVHSAMAHTMPDDACDRELHLRTSSLITEEKQSIVKSDTLDQWQPPCTQLEIFSLSTTEVDRGIDELEAITMVGKCESSATIPDEAISS